MELSRVWTVVSVVPIPRYQMKNVGTCLDIVSMKRFKEEVNFRCVFSPVIFQDSVICYNGHKKQRYRSVAQYEPRPKPKIFNESIVIYPKRTEMTYVATVDYHIDECRKWFRTTMEFKAKTYTTTKIQNMNGKFMKKNESYLDDDDNRSSSCHKNNDWHNNSSCDVLSHSSIKSGERKGVGVTSNDGPGVSLIYLPRFEKEEHIKSCNFNLMDSAAASENLLFLQDSSDDEVDV